METGTQEKLYIGGVEPDDERCLRCGSFALDTGWECNDCGYDNMPHYYSKPKETATLPPNNQIQRAR